MGQYKLKINYSKVHEIGNWKLFSSLIDHFMNIKMCFDIYNFYFLLIGRHLYFFEKVINY